MGAEFIRRLRTGILAGLLACGATAAAAEAQDRYYDEPLLELGWLGEGPGTTDYEWAWGEKVWVLEPYVVLDGPGEAYVRDAQADASWRSGFGPPELSTLRVSFRVPAGEAARGKLYLPTADYDGMTAHPFEVAASEASADHRQAFLLRKLGYYQDLVEHDYPGGAWFRYQARLVREELDLDEEATARALGWRRRGELEDTFELFSGGRAISENLALDRLLDPAGGKERMEESIPFDELEGITVAAIDWAPLVKGLEPELDPLARWIPEDQHAVFFPSFTALTELVDEAQEAGTPLLQLLEPRAEDARTQQHYQRQLCLGLSDFARKFGPAVVKSVALTGSDPFWRTGSDVAFLFECAEPQLLEDYLRLRQRQALVKHAGAEEVEGELGELEYAGVVTPLREVSSYVSRVGDVVCVTNSLVQLERLAQLLDDGSGSIARLEEYTYMRARYPRGHADESAFFLVSDATIRRWSGPRSRIGNSRRTRVAALMSARQAANIEPILAGAGAGAVLDAEPRVPGCGPLLLGPGGVYSEVYGDLRFLTPIAELPMKGATAEEKVAYDNFRTGYQNRWRVFDPIGGRLGVKPGALSFDMTVMPLIAGTEYRELIELTRGVQLAPDAGDARPEAMLTWIMALDPDSAPVRDVQGMAGSMLGLGDSALAWMGGHLAVVAEEDPFWAELAAAEDSEDFLDDNLHRLPFSLEIGVTNPLKLAAFLTALRSFVDGAAPDMLAWTNRQHAGRTYVRIGLGDPELYDADEFASWALHYVVLPDALVFSLSESIVQRAIERRFPVDEPAAAEAEEGVAPEVRPWLGESAALRLDRRALDLLRGLARDPWDESMRLTAWKALPILEEWRRRFPDQDPVAVHERLWGTRLVSPGGGAYVWDAETGRMVSTVYGAPAQPLAGPELPEAVRRLEGLDMGVSFEEDGLRARVELTRRPR